MWLINAIAQTLECVLSTWPKGEASSTLSHGAQRLRESSEFCASLKTRGAEKVLQRFTLQGEKQMFLLRTYKHPVNVKQMERLV